MEVTGIDVQTLGDWLERGQAVLIDVREDFEYAEEHIPGAAHIPLSRFSPSAVPMTGNKKTVLHCLVGGRSRKAGQMLLQAGHEEAFHLEGGLLAWVAAGRITRSAA